MIYGKKVYGVVTAAGSGSRMNRNQTKQFIEIKGKSILEWTLEKLDASAYIDQIVLVTREDELQRAQGLLNKLKKSARAVVGGSSREESTYKGLADLEPDSIVLTHDGARPFIRPELIDSALEKFSQYKSIILGVPAVDTIKKVKGASVEETLERATLYHIQTPQIFETGLIQKAYEKFKGDYSGFTDDSSLVEALGEKIYIHPGDYQNIKVTTEDDLLLGQLIMEGQAKENENR